MGKFGRTFLIFFLIATVTSCEKDEGGASAMQNASFTIPDYSDAVDLGLSVRWAPFNIGASDTYEYGNYYAWGETDFKKSYTEKTYSQPQTDDYNGIAAGSYDVAGVQWGKGWRLPTKREIEELEKLCKRSESDVYGSRVIKYKAANGNSIILPAAGYISDKKLKSAGIKGFYMCGSEYAAKSPYFSDSLGREAGISVNYDCKLSSLCKC